MPEQLVVLVGAGASHDCTRMYPHDDAWRPRLVTELFEPRPTFTRILAEYPDAQTLAPDLRVAVASGAPGLEDYLRDHVLHSRAAYDRRRYRSIPLYLQHVLFEVSRNFTAHPVSYDRLINACVRSANETLFVTLNYDTLLDRRLSLHTPIRTLVDYIDAATEWSLFKLHGSIDWMRAIEGDVSRGGTYTNRITELEELTLSTLIVLHGVGDIHTTREQGQGGTRTRFYPALSVPLGAEDEFNCPDEHVARLRERLSAVDGLHVLTVGYSGWDSSLLRLLRESGNSLRSLKVVNRNGEEAFEAAKRIAAPFGHEVSSEVAFGSGFNDFAHSLEIAQYLDSLD